MLRGTAGGARRLGASVPELCVPEPENVKSGPICKRTSLLNATTQQVAVPACATTTNMPAIVPSLTVGTKRKSLVLATFQSLVETASARTRRLGAVIELPEQGAAGVCVPSASAADVPQPLHTHIGDQPHYNLAKEPSCTTARASEPVVATNTAYAARSSAVLAAQHALQALRNALAGCSHTYLYQLEQQFSSAKGALSRLNDLLLAPSDTQCCTGPDVANPVCILADRPTTTAEPTTCNSQGIHGHDDLLRVCATIWVSLIQ
jgi:hypothetical protein